jgi:hypothetical protein
MALPSSEVIDLAKAYAHQIETGRTPQQAREYLLEFAATPSQISSAIRQAQRAMRVGEVLETFIGQPTRTIREALEGQRAPAARVGVRVEVTRIRQLGSEWEADRKNTLYIEMSWDDTIGDVIARARSWFEATEHGSGPAFAWELEFKGPTLWPGQSPAEYGGL